MGVVLFSENCRTFCIITFCNSGNVSEPSHMFKPPIQHPLTLQLRFMVMRLDIVAPFER